MIRVVSGLSAAFIVLVAFGCQVEPPQQPADGRLSPRAEFVLAQRDSFIATNREAISAALTTVYEGRPLLAKALMYNQLTATLAVACDTTCEPLRVLREFGDQVEIDRSACPDPLFDRVEECSNRYPDDDSGWMSCMDKAFEGGVCGG